jgi:hypothetical protein
MGYNKKQNRVKILSITSCISHGDSSRIYGLGSDGKVYTWLLDQDDSEWFLYDEEE